MNLTNVIVKGLIASLPKESQERIQGLADGAAKILIDAGEDGILAFLLLAQQMERHIANSNSSSSPGRCVCGRQKVLGPAGWCCPDTKMGHAVPSAN